MSPTQPHCTRTRSDALLMLDLLATLVPIALIDSLSLIPVAVVPLALLLGGRQPVAGALAFVAGVLVIYTPFGLLLTFGLDELFDALSAHFSAWWNRTPDFGEVVLEIVVGLLLLVAGQRICEKRGSQTDEERPRGMTPLQGFLSGFILTVTGLWGALPYFAAVSQILKEDLPPAGMMGAILFYNLVFALPLFAMLAVHFLLGDRSERWFGKLAVFITHWGKRFISLLLIGLGFLMVVDGIGWLNGWPLLLPDSQDTVATQAAHRFFLVTVSLR